MKYFYCTFLALCIAVTGFLATPFPQDDFFLYQKFVETLASGKLDLTIAGFHGTGLFAVPIYLLTQSPLAHIYTQLLFAVLLPFAAFFAGRALWKSEQAGVFLATIIALTPFVLFVGLRGWTGAGYTFLLLLSVFAIFEKKKWAPVVIGLAIITKPFAVCLLPLLVYVYTDLSPEKLLSRQGMQTTIRKAWKPVCITLVIPVAYVLIQFLQVGHVIVGAHETYNHANIWMGPTRIILNLGHALQILFSVHNYYFPDPALTGPGNLMHTTPVLTFLGLFAIFSNREEYGNIALQRTLLLAACVGIGLNALLDHMDHFYMWAGVLMLILAALPLLSKSFVWSALSVATLHFQWLYFYLANAENYQLGYWFFLVPLVVDGCFVVYWWVRCPAASAGEPTAN